MIDISEIVNDPDFAQPYTVYRQTGAWIEGSFVLSPETIIPFFGVITAANQRELIQLPEGDRVSGMMVFYSTDNQFYLTRTSDSSSGVDGISDQIEWRSDRYKVVKVWPYADYGYWKCIATRMSGE